MSQRDAILALESAINQQVLGQDAVVRMIVVGLLADGHILLESLPGLAKTRTVRALASNLDARMSRIQFTPDLLPSDITGADVLQADGAGGHRIQFQQGPLFGNIILADEINRAPAKVQSALLEAMEERQVTVGGTTRPMPALFMVVATQNPIEQEGTYPLPEAQMDRFLMKIRLDYPAAADEAAMLALLRHPAAAGGTRAAAPLSQEALFSCRDEVAAVQVAPAVDEYIVDLVNATRRPADHDADLGRWLQIGASPRGAIALDRAARAHAWLSGAAFSTPDDVRAVALPVLRHRLHLSYDAVADGLTSEAVIGRLLDTVAVPA
ncbi:AAA family ATPase [Achromobacter xylosoxidans]|uniref:AAA family ATPase n=1 Tax=Achromobacter TaxID=222 RepID=UPI0006C07761|nr:AAA family ATPase [Achromobacter xylosoxidans]AXA78427.1 AAA family ATPase [Achromobacter xylosoxidans]MCH4595545.1 AAA family ATPase [Achromobacter xylosoxidans]MCM2573051.1 AAA family ATPase [Achromobacter xylosoxidans]CUJ05964.1 regulatory ATPase RavA [Achromobacter xylosoxidans]CUR81786.1 Denitrification regulatory protein NirQ [Achromobacter xylosoxidans]